MHQQQQRMLQQKFSAYPLWLLPATAHIEAKVLWHRRGRKHVSGEQSPRLLGVLV